MSRSPFRPTLIGWLLGVCNLFMYGVGSGTAGMLDSLETVPVCVSKLTLMLGMWGLTT